MRIMMALPVVSSLAGCVEVTPIEENTYHDSYSRDRSIMVVTCDAPDRILESLERGYAVYGCADVRIEGWNNVRVKEFTNVYGQQCLAQVVEFHNSQPGGFTWYLRQGAYTLQCVRNNYYYPYYGWD